MLHNGHVENLKNVNITPFMSAMLVEPSIAGNVNCGALSPLDNVGIVFLVIERDKLFQPKPHRTIGKIANNTNGDAAIPTSLKKRSRSDFVLVFATLSNSSCIFSSMMSDTFPAPALAATLLRLQQQKQETSGTQLSHSQCS